jgi:hypothetical protein
MTVGGNRTTVTLFIKGKKNPPLPESLGSREGDGTGKDSEPLGRRYRVQVMPLPPSPVLG